MLVAVYIPDDVSGVYQDVSVQNDSSGTLRRLGTSTQGVIRQLGIEPPNFRMGRDPTVTGAGLC